MQILRVSSHLSIVLACCLAQNISQQKCIEYSKEVYQMEPVQTLSLKPKFKKVDVCGIISSPLIVGGVQARIKEFPHMASIGYSKGVKHKLKWKCGGTLISPKTVLTAAHCDKNKESEPRKVRLGVVDLDEEPHYMQEIFIEHFVTHPQYKKPEAYYDIAIIFLARAAQFSAYVRPACVNTLEHLPFTRVEAIGFGKLDQFDSSGSPKLMKVELDVIEIDVCQQYVVDKVSVPHGLRDFMLCAGKLEEGGKDTCQGDSGGPLHVALREPYCMYSIVGLTSFGKTCGLEYSPGVYTRIYSFIPWIESMVWGKEFD